MDPDSKYPLKVLYCGGTFMQLLKFFWCLFRLFHTVIQILLCLSSVLFAYRGKFNSVTNCLI